MFVVIPTFLEKLLGFYMLFTGSLCLTVNGSAGMVSHATKMCNPGNCGLQIS